MSCIECELVHVLSLLVVNSRYKSNVLILKYNLFIRGCGRTDFQGGDPGVLYDSVTQRLFTLPEDVLVYPGHDYRGQTTATIGEEKRANPRFVGRARENFVVLMNSLGLPKPKKMLEVLPANTFCGFAA
jgi:sulfur dioxygenase